MIRDIKFRAWIKEQKQMVEVIELNFHQATIASIYDDYASGEQEWDLEDFKNVELMQYVGLKDKNGTEIYEGDIVMIMNKEDIYSVNYGEFGVPNVDLEVYQDLAVGFFIKPEHDLKNVIPFSLTIPLNTSYSKDVMVIGNIYENPELLQEES